MKLMDTIACSLGLMACAGVAHANTFFVFQEETMYRFELGNTADQFDLGRTMISSSTGGARLRITISSSLTPVNHERMRIFQRSQEKASST